MLSAAKQTGCQNVSRDFDTKMSQGDSWNKAYRFFCFFFFVCFCFLMLVLFEDSCQHCVSNGNNGLIKTKGLSMVCRGCQIQHQKTCAAQNWGCL